MTNWNPNVRVVDPAHAPDLLSEGVVFSLTRPMNPKLRWGPIKTLLLGLVTGGLLPLLILPKRFRDFINAEQTHMWHFAEWLRLRYPGPETERFQAAVAKLKFRPALWIGSIVLAALAVVWAWSDIVKMADRAVIETPLVEFSTRLPQGLREIASVPRALLAAEGFALLLVAAHLLSLWQVVAHVGSVRHVVDLYNTAQKHGLSQVERPEMGSLWSSAWIACALVTVLLGAWWGVLMMLAAGAQARYINGSGRKLRMALAARVFNLLADQRPLVHLDLPAELRGICSHKGCAAPVPAGADFCPRCGQRVRAEIDSSAA